MTKLNSQIEDLQKAIARLDEALKMEKTDTTRDSAIHRFEIVFDLAWKTLKNYLEEYCNAVCNSPRSCFKEGFLNGVIEHNQFWLDVCKERNYVAHTYREVLADKIYADLPMALENFKKLLEKISMQV